MAFSVFALLGEGAPQITSDSLADMARNYFKEDESLTIQFSQLPFHDHRSVDLAWNGWLASLTYDEGDEIAKESAEISEILGSAAPSGLSKIRRRISAFFCDDEDMAYTNEIILIWQFLNNMPDVVLFDPQQRSLIDFSE